jgi:hypothetical protein
MTVAIAFVVLAVSYGVYLLARDFVTRSIRSYGSAEHVWGDLIGTADKLMASDIPESVARAVLGLVAAAGCGCFVRGMLVNHYLPRPSLVKSGDAGPWNKAFEDVENLTAEQRGNFYQLLAATVVYDSFRNPFQGWMFRRILKTFLQPNPSFVQKAETQITAFSILTRRGLSLKQI